MSSLNGAFNLTKKKLESLLHPRTKMPGSEAYMKGRQLSDGRYYIISVFDCEAAGVLLRAYHQDDNMEYILTPSNREFEAAGLARADEHYDALVESLDIKTDEDEHTFLSSSLPGIQDPKFIPQGDKAKAALAAVAAGTGTLPELLKKGLAELCRAKPNGLDAVEFLGNWLLQNNPNRPAVE